jgi:hypothetical protein
LVRIEASPFLLVRAGRIAERPLMGFYADAAREASCHTPPNTGSVITVPIVPDFRCSRAWLSY